MSKKQKKKIEETINKYTTDEFSVVEYLKSIEADQFAEEEEDYKFISIFELLDAPRILPDPVELTFEHLKQIEDELGLIKLCWPVIEEAEFEGRTQFPPSYLGNNEKEKLLLFTTENFRQEFRFRYPERKQLFLACDNECGIQKMVCTTIRATTLPYPETETWQLCSSFFGDYLKFEPLEIPTLFLMEVTYDTIKVAFIRHFLAEQWIFPTWLKNHRIQGMKKTCTKRQHSFKYFSAIFPVLESLRDGQLDLTAL